MIRKEIYFCFDESELSKNKQMLGCIVFEDKKIFNKIKEIKRIISFDSDFFQSEDFTPHYTDDSHNLRVKILDRYKFLQYKFYAVINENQNKAKIYESNLSNLIKPIIIKYLKKFNINDIKFYFMFEQLDNFGDNYFKKIIDKNFKNIEVEVSKISKNDYEGISSIPDYNLGALREYLINKNKENRDSFGKSIFYRIISKIGYIKIEGNEKESFFYFKNYKDKYNFINEYHGKYK